MHVYVLNAPRKSQSYVTRFCNWFRVCCSQHKTFLFDIYIGRRRVHETFSLKPHWLTCVSEMHNIICLLPKQNNILSYWGICPSFDTRNIYVIHRRMLTWSIRLQWPLVRPWRWSMARCTTTRHVQLRRYSTETHATFRVHSVTLRQPLTVHTGVQRTEYGVTTSFANVCESITWPTHSCNLLFCRFYQ